MRSASGTRIYRPDIGMVVSAFVDGQTAGFIGPEIMPYYDVPEKAGSYPVIPAKTLLSLEDVDRAARGAYNRSSWEYEEGIYQTYERGHEEPIDDSERKILDQRKPGLADMVCANRAASIIARAQEYRVANKVFNATNFTAHAVTNEWDDAANATPLDDVNDGIVSFRNQCGMTPDCLVLSWKVFRNLRSCTQIVNQLKYTFPGIDINRLSAAQLAAVLDVPEVKVAGAMYDSADKGQSVSVSDIWSGEYAALMKIHRGDDLKTAGFGRTFIWTADSPQTPVVEMYREEQIRSDIMRVRHSVEEVYIQSKNSSGTVVSNIADKCIYLFSNITT